MASQSLPIPSEPEHISAKPPLGPSGQTPKPAGILGSAGNCSGFIGVGLHVIPPPDTVKCPCAGLENPDTKPEQFPAEPSIPMGFGVCPEGPREGFAEMCSGSQVARTKPEHIRVIGYNRKLLGFRMELLRVNNKSRVCRNHMRKRFALAHRSAAPPSPTLAAR